jgi:predicted short-subunit dehydrogenase-like oxidoreductase (DUF2520 family)
VKRPSIAIVGPGRLGTALAVHLHRAGYRIDEVVGGATARSHARAVSLARKLEARASQSHTAWLEADLVWFCVPDAQIAKAAVQFSSKSWKGQFAFHSSGVLSSELFAPVRKRGAAIASVHPLMTFINSRIPDLENVVFAIEGDTSAVRIAHTIVSKLKGISKRIRKQDKSAYHAFATIICPLLLTLLATAEEAANIAGVSRRDARKRMLPIVKQTLANYFNSSAAKAFTGPIVRGDAETVGLHLQALAKSPVTQNAYAALAQAAIELLPSRKKNELTKLMTRFSSRPLR